MGPIVLTRCCAIHTCQKADSQKPLSVQVTCTQLKFCAGLASSSPVHHHPPFQKEFCRFQRQSEVYGSGSLAQLENPSECKQDDSSALITTSPYAKKLNSCSLDYPTTSFRSLGIQHNDRQLCELTVY